MSQRLASKNFCRAWQALCLLCVFLAGLMYRPSDPTLICRVTGRPMQPVYDVAAPLPATPLPCCRIHRVGDGYALTAPGCCDLRQGGEHKTLCLTPLSLSDMVAGGLPPIRLTAPLPLVKDVSASGSMPRLFFFIRPPPLGALALRAPPA